MKKLKFTKYLLIILLLSSCKTSLDKNKPLNINEFDDIEDANPTKNKMEIRFSCGEDGISEYIDDGWTIVEVFSEEKICTWKSTPASKDCDMEKDKGCKITKPDKIGEEKIYLLEK